MPRRRARIQSPINVSSACLRRTKRRHGKHRPQRGSEVRTLSGSVWRCEEGCVIGSFSEATARAPPNQRGTRFCHADPKGTLLPPPCHQVEHHWSADLIICRSNPRCRQPQERRPRAASLAYLRVARHGQGLSAPTGINLPREPDWRLIAGKSLSGGKAPLC